MTAEVLLYCSKYELITKKDQKFQQIVMSVKNKQTVFDTTTADFFTTVYILPLESKVHSSNNSHLPAVVKMQIWLFNFPGLLW